MKFLSSLSALCVMAAAVLLPAATRAAGAGDVPPPHPVQGAALGQWTQDLAAAEALAAETGKPILLNFTGSDWCGACHMADEIIFAKKEWQDFAAQNVVMVALDFPQDQARTTPAFMQRNLVLQKKYGVSGYPTFILLDSDGETKLTEMMLSQGVNAAVFKRQVSDAMSYMAVNIDAFATELGDRGDAYRQAITDWRKAEAELDTLMSTLDQNDPSARAKYHAATKAVAEAEFDVQDFRIRHDARQLPAEQQEKYLAAWTAMRGGMMQYFDFMATEPDQSQENLAKFQGIVKIIRENEAVMQQIEETF